MDPFARKNVNAGYKTDKQRHDEDIQNASAKSANRAKADTAKKALDDKNAKRDVYKPQF